MDEDPIAAILSRKPRSASSQDRDLVTSLSKRSVHELLVLILSEQVRIRAELNTLHARVLGIVDEPPGADIEQVIESMWDSYERWVMLFGNEMDNDFDLVKP